MKNITRFGNTLEDVVSAWLADFPVMFGVADIKAYKTDIDRAKYMMNWFNKLNPVPEYWTSEKGVKPCYNFITDGDSSYKKGEFKNALDFYNSAFMYAPVDSTLYVECLSNMVNCHISMNNFEKALILIEIALKCTEIKPEHKEKLEKQKEHCEKFVTEKMDVVGVSPSEPVLCSTSEYLTSASNKVTMSNNKKGARVLRASADIHTGELLMVEEPYAFLMLPILRKTHCWHCTKSCDRPRPCTECSQAVFCSEHCVKEAKKYHDYECPLMDMLVEKTIARNFEILALRMFLIATENGTKIKELKEIVDNIETKRTNSKTFDSHDFLRGYDLKVYGSDCNPAEVFLDAFVAHFFVSALDMYTTLFKNQQDMLEFSISLLLRLIMNAGQNKVDVTYFNGKSSEKIGEAIYVTFNLLNHSCDPNVVPHFYNSRLVLRSIKPIKAGKQLTYSYGWLYLNHDGYTRRRRLKERFTCKCLPCGDKWPTFPDIPKYKPRFFKPSEEVEARFTELSTKFHDTFKFKWTGSAIELTEKVEFTPEHLELMCAYVDFLDEHVWMPWRGYPVCQEVLKLGLAALPTFHRTLTA